MPSFTQEENEILTRVGPGTPMGELMRRYWIPAFLSEELPGPDCPPVRTRLLGEDLVGYRDTQGRVGLLAAYCSHRQAPLFFGRNEEGGLRCLYHGWKYDVDGNCLETPGEPPESQVRFGIHHKAYPCVEINRLIYTYMGPPEKRPLFPAVHWLTLPQEQVNVGCKFFLECNWLQSLDGDNDLIHTSYLHSRGLRNDERFNRPRPGAQRGYTGQPGNGAVRRRTRARYLKAVETDDLSYGVQGAMIYPTDDPEVLAVTADTFYMPCNGLLGGGQHVIYQVPADDYTCWRYDIILNLTGPISDEYSLDYRFESWPELGKGYPGWTKKMNRENDYLMDRARQKTFEIYAGIDARNHTQDAMMTENMGPRVNGGNIVDRSKEHYGVSDGLVVRMHQYMLQAVKDMQEGKDPPGIAYRPEDNVYPRGLGGNFEMKPGENWRDYIPLETTKGAQPARV